MNTNITATHSPKNRATAYPYSVLQGGLAGPAPVHANNDPTRNQLLACLPAAQLEALLPHLERVEMSAGDVIYEYGGHSQHVYFPATSIVSLIYDMEDGASAEVAIVGNEGMVGVGVFMAGETMPGLAQVQCAGYGYRLSARVLKQEFDRSGPLQHALLCYVQALMVEIAQNAVCNRHHSIRQQLCRCLLLSLDRSVSNELALTHEMIGASLGVRRECVTVAAGKLRAEGMIDYKRGHITVLDREALEHESCECYQVVKNTFERLLPHRAATVPAADATIHYSGSPHFHAAR
ncbi:MAG: Crp/Fnr family transcriptional regulator, partial [Betaproteobacteria bacterium]